MLRLHLSNRIEALAAALIDRLGGARDDPFAAETVIVPSTAVARWLTLAIARERGICARVQFDFFARWAWRQIARVVPGTPPASPFAPGPLAWRVHALFGEADWVSRHPRLAGYLNGADARARHDLATRVAALLDQALTYRVDWLDAWRQGRLLGLDGSDEAWQAELWRRLVERIGLDPLAPARSFAAGLDGDDPADTAGLPQRLQVFALPALPPSQLQLLARLARVIEVDVYALNPCREYWFDLIDPRRFARMSLRARGRRDAGAASRGGTAAAPEAGAEVGHPLLAHWGRQAQAMLDGLFEAGLESDGESTLDDTLYREPEGSSLLAQLQRSLLDLAPPAPASMPLEAGDRSLEIHRCHSLTRQLEVLHDRLLGAFAADATLRPGEILVALPDLDAAAPSIDGLFGTQPAARRIPYTITGRARQAAAEGPAALLALLDLLGSRVGVRDLFALLQRPPVARRFEFGDDELEQLREFLLDAGAHWGLDGEQRAAQGLAGGERHTLADAIERLFLGLTLAPATAAVSPGLQLGPGAGATGLGSSGCTPPFAGLLPAAGGPLADAALLARLWLFADALRGLARRSAEAQTASRWVALLIGATQAFIVGANPFDAAALEDAVRAWGREVEQAAPDEPLPLALVRQTLAERLDDPARGGVPTGGVTFASLASLRGLPFRWICLLGLDDGVLPSRQGAAEFDLLAANPRRGDRQRRQDDRGLFLDALLAAREVLHSSYSGRSVHDNRVLPPSPLLAELQELVRSATGRSDAHGGLLIDHPLQAFASQAFDPDADARLRSHDAELAAAVRSARESPGADPAAPRTDPIGTAGAADAVEAFDDDPDDDDAAESAATSGRFFHSALPPVEAAAGPRRLALADLLAFYRNPSRHLLRARLALQLPWDEAELQDNEPLQPERGVRDRLDARVLAAALAGADAAAIDALIAASPEHLNGPLGRLHGERTRGELMHFAQRIRNAAPVAPGTPSQPFELPLRVAGEDWLLHGALPARARGAPLLLYSLRELHPVDRLHGWILHLVAGVMDAPGDVPTTRLLARDRSLRLDAVVPAATPLADLVALYSSGLCEPLPFFPRSAWALTAPGGSWRKAQETWAPAGPGRHGEQDDVAYRIALRGRDALDAAFADTAQRVYGPLIAAALEEDALT